jgi:hypothetical protein
VPGALLFRFFKEEALGSLRYCLIDHNLIAAAERHSIFDVRAVVTLVLFSAVVWWGRRLLAGGSPLAFRRGFVVLAAGLYPVLLFVVWPLVTREDFLPFVPLVMLMIVAGVLVLGESVNRSGVVNALLAVVVLVLAGLDAWTVKPWQNRLKFQQHFLAGVLDLSEPGDEVMDTKGEMIFRDRPFYFALEEMTRWRFSRNVLEDDLPERMVARRVCLATDNYGRFPVRARRFIKKNFVRVAFRTLVAGKKVWPVGPVTFFDVAIPARYAVVAQDRGQVLLDGTLVDGSVWLRPGRHFITAPAASGPVAVVWATAVERGFSPFYKPSREEQREAVRSNLDNIL